MFGEVGGVLKWEGGSARPHQIHQRCVLVLHPYGSLTCQVPRTYHAGSGVVHADKAGEAFTRQPLDAHGGRRQVARLRDPRGRVRVKVGR